MKINSLFRKILVVAGALLSYHFANAETAMGVIAVGLSTTTDSFSKCLPALRTNIATCGAVTLCDLSFPKPSELDTIFKDGSQYRVLKHLFMHQMELNACEAVQSSLQKFLMANRVDMSKKLSVTQLSTDLLSIRPYILAKRKSPINNNYWNVTAGSTAGAGDWQVTVSSPTGIPVSVNWFNADERVFIKGQTAGGTETNSAWIVVSAALEGSTVVLQLNSQNANSFLTEDQVENPVTGLLVRGTANKNDYESFCLRGPGLLTDKWDEFWIETTRDITCEDELYKKWRDLVFANNPLYETMYDLTTIEYNKQSGEDFYRRLANTFFWNKPLVNQTLETVDDLVTIEGIQGLSGGTGVARCVGKKANAIGIFEQHVQCNRYIDLQGEVLNINALAKALYKMWRIRKDTGAKNPKIFEAFIPSQYFPAFNRAMLHYYDVQAGRTIQYQKDIDIEKGVAPLGFVYHDYPLVWPDQVILRVTTDEYFDDLLTAAVGAGLTTSGYQMWILDWSKNYMGIIETNRVRNQTADIGTLAGVDAAQMCRMKSLGQTIVMTSLTWTAVAECPAADLIIGNFSGAEPNVTDAGDEYGATTTTTTSTTTAA